MSNKKLVDLLSEKTDLSNEEVEERLQKLRKHISNELKKKQTCTLNGLGTFSLQEGELNFSPDDKLAMEVNHTYAGMKPIELIGAYKEMSDVVEAGKEKPKDISVVPPVDSGVEKYQQKEEEPVIAEDSKDEESKEAEEKEVVEPAADSDTPAEAVPEAETDTEPEPVEEEAPAQPVAADDDSTRETGPPESEPRPEKQTKEESGDPIGKWLVAAVIVIALGLGGWLVYDMGFSGNGNSEGVSQASTGQPVAQADPGVRAVDAGTGSSTNSDAGNGDGSETGGNDASVEPPASEQDGQNSISEDTRIAEESRQSIYGLRGGATPEAQDGYTIVVHSLRDEAKVRRVNAELQQQGYRTIIYSASVLDTTFWRLGLGQFKTVEDAQQAVVKLPDIYRENHFIKRIQ